MPALTEADAKRLTLQLKLLFGSVADQIDRVKELIGQAKSGQADVALGYKSWTAYCETEFAGALPVLERPRRLELVSSLTELGMSSRAIAPIVRVTDRQVRKDQQVGTQFPPGSSPADECDPDAEIVDAEILEDTQNNDFAKMTKSLLKALNELPDPEPPAVHRPQITGRDGKTYTPPVPRKQRRGSLPDSYRHAVHDLDKAIRRLERLHADDRFDGNRKALSDIHWKLFSDLQSRLFDLDHHLFSGNHIDDPDGVA